MDLLFLGAGASSPFGIPTMQEMVEGFEASLQDRLPLEMRLYQNIKSAQRKSYGSSRVDIESVFSVISGIADDVKPEDLGYLAHYYTAYKGAKGGFSETDVQHAKTLRYEMCRFIKQACKLQNRSENKRVLDNSYHALFSCLYADQNNKRSYVSDWIAYTTNYDEVFEGFCADFCTLDDYFMPYYDSEHKVFKPSEKPVKPYLVKLHGSINWLINESKEILKIHNPDLSVQNIKGEAMVFPIQQKDLYLDPWITLFQDLKEHLQSLDRWIVIGYGFNDEFILEVFKEALTNKKTLVIINPEACFIRNKFPLELRGNIDALPIKFGDPHFKAQFNDYIDATKKIVINLKTPANDIGFYSTSTLLNMHVSGPDGRFKPFKYTSSRGINQIFVKELEHDADDMLACEITMQVDSPFDKDFNIRFSSFSENTPYDIDIRYLDKPLACDKGHTLPKNDDSYSHSRPIRLNTSQLFRRDDP